MLASLAALVLAVIPPQAVVRAHVRDASNVLTRNRGEVVFRKGPMKLVLVRDPEVAVDGRLYFTVKVKSWRSGGGLEARIGHKLVLGSRTFRIAVNSSGATTILNKIPLR